MNANRQPAYYVVLADQNLQGVYKTLVGASRRLRELLTLSSRQVEPAGYLSGDPESLPVGLTLDPPSVDFGDQLRVMLAEQQQGQNRPAQPSEDIPMAIYRAAKFVRGKLVKTCQHKHATRTHAVGCALYARNLTAQFKNLMSQTDSGITVAALRFEQSVAWRIGQLFAPEMMVRQHMVAFEEWKHDVDIAVLMLCGTTEALSTYHYLEAWQAGYSPEHAAIEALASQLQGDIGEGD